MSKHEVFLLIIVALLAFAVFSPTITGALSMTPDIKISVPSSMNATSSRPVDKIDKIDIDTGFWESFFKNIIGTIPEESVEEIPAEDECCAGVDDQLTNLQNQIGDLQNKVDEMEARQNAPCPQFAIESGSCQTACERQGLKCATSHYRRTFLDVGLFGDITRTLIYAELADCDEDFYFPADTEVQDEYQCSCC